MCELFIKFQYKTKLNGKLNKEKEEEDEGGRETKGGGTKAVENICCHIPFSVVCWHCFQIE